MRTRGSLFVLAAAGVAAVFAPAGARAAGQGGFVDIITHQDVADFYKQNKDIRKIQDQYQKDVQRRKEGQCVPTAADSYARFNKDARSEDSPIPGADTSNNKPDLIREYKEERGLVIEENIRRITEEKATQAVRELYRDYLRAVYWRGGAKDGDGAKHLHYIRSLLEKPDGWRSFPTADMGPALIEGAAATYSSGFPGHVRMTTGVFDIVVFSHEMFHWSDDRFGGVDGESSKEVEPHAYGHMGTDLAGGGGPSGGGGGEASEGGSSDEGFGGRSEGNIAGSSEGNGPGSPMETCSLDGQSEDNIAYGRGESAPYERRRGPGRQDGVVLSHDGRDTEVPEGAAEDVEEPEDPDPGLGGSAERDPADPEDEPGRTD